MSTYLLNTLNNLKNKDIESIAASNSLEDLLTSQDPNQMILNSLVNNTINELVDNKHFYKTSLKDVNINELIKSFDISSDEKKELEAFKEEDNVKDFLNSFNQILSKTISNPDSKTYSIVGDYVKLINTLGKRGIITPTYMDIMVESINKIKEPKIEEIDASKYLMKKIKSYLSIEGANTYNNKRILVEAHQKLFMPDADGKRMCDALDNEDIIYEYFKDVFYSDGSSKVSPPFDTLKSELINDGFSINKIDIQDKITKFSEINTLKKAISNLENIGDYSLEEVKQFFEVLYLDNNDLTEYLSIDGNLGKVKDNKFMAELKYEDILLNNEQIQKLNVVKNISNFNSSIHELYGKDININVSELFYKKFNIDLESEKSKEYTRSLLDKYVSLKDKTKNPNNNILLYITLSSFNSETKEYDSKLENKYISLLTKPLKKYNDKDRALLNTIDDSWLKWAICHNREFKDNTLTFTAISPLQFNFGEFAKIRKELGRNLTKDEIEMTQVSSLFPNITFDDLKSYMPTTEKNRNILSAFLSIEDYNIKLDSIESNIEKDDFFSLLNIYNVFNENSKLLNDIADSGLDISSILKSDKQSIQNVLSNLSEYNSQEILAIGKMLENPKVVPGNMDNLNNYIKDYAKFMQTPEFKFYEKENSTIPILDYAINKNYDIRSLTAHEFSAFINGEVCKHCMSYKGASWNMLEYMKLKPENFLITQLEKNGIGVANSATWRVDNHLCFDSIEVVNNGQGIRDSILMAYKEHSLKLLMNDSSLDRITFGYSNHNNQIDFGNVGIKTNNSSHPLITLPVNIYSDAKNNQSIIFSLNIHDLKSPEINRFQIDSLLEYAKYKDGKDSLIQEFLTKYSDKLDKLVNVVDKSIVEKIPNKDKLEALLNDYGIVNKTLGNVGQSDRTDRVMKDIEGEELYR